MTANLPSVLEVKFACPHCNQHIACDSAYCGTRIECPACRQEMAVPRLSAFDPPSGGGLRLAPPAGPAPRPEDTVDPPLPDPWTEDEWNQRVAESNARDGFSLPGSIALQSWFWLFFLAPLVLFFLGGGFEFRWLSITSLQIIFLLCAVFSGFLLGKSVSTSLPGFIISGILFSALIIVADLFVCFVGGCAMACSQTAGGAR